jgi:hypothetical protein
MVDMMMMLPHTGASRPEYLTLVDIIEEAEIERT